jgi:4-amino-4-deoxy-L-arabinose transferase-like glycosyltransferase
MSRPAECYTAAARLIIRQEPWESRSDIVGEALVASFLEIDMAQCSLARSGVRQETVRLSDRAGYALVALLWSVQVAVNVWWLKIDTRPPVYDTAGHAMATLRLAEAPFLTHPLTALKLVLGIDPYPPFVYLVSLPFAYLLGTTVDAFLGSHAIFMAILLFATYALGRRLDQPRTGVMAAFLVGMYPILYGLSRHYLLDIPLVAMVTLAICCLVYSEDFRRPVPSALFGVSLGLGMLTKWTFAIFISAPFLISLIVMLTRYSPNRLRNGWLSVLLGCLIAGPWYLCQLANLQSFLNIGRVYAALEGDPSVTLWKAWTYYADALINHQIFLPFAALFVVGLVLLLARCRPDRSLWVLLAWLVVPYLVFSGFVNKDVRYVLPYLPAVALITALGLGRIRSAKTAGGVWAAILVYALVQFAGLTFGISPRLRTGFVPPSASIHWGTTDLTLYQEFVHIASPPRADDWLVQDILADILQDAAERRQTGKLISLVVVPNRPFFETQGFRFHAMAAHLPVQAFSVTGAVAIDAASRLEATDYVVTKTGDLGPAWSLQDAVAVTRAMHDPESDLGRRFVQIGEYPLPDGSIARLYRHDQT